jgi:peptidoglycan/LPS O-acetylase OafA/YrhL
MTRTSSQRLRLIRVCVRIQCTFGIVAGLAGAAVAIFCAATATDDPEDWSGVFVAVGAHAAVVGFGLSALLLLLARRVERPAARRALITVEVLVAAALLARPAVSLSPGLPGLFGLGLLVPGVAVVAELMTVETAAREHR